jgi:hypothetical protein
VRPQAESKGPFPDGNYLIFIYVTPITLLFTVFADSYNIYIKGKKEVNDNTKPSARMGRKAYRVSILR